MYYSIVGYCFYYVNYGHFNLVYRERAGCASPGAVRLFILISLRFRPDQVSGSAAAVSFPGGTPGS